MLSTSYLRWNCGADHARGGFDVVVKNVIEVATKGVKVKAYRVSVCREEYESHNTDTEMGKGILSLLSGKKHHSF